MLKTNLRNPDGPLYREVLRGAFKIAWHERRFWILSFFAFFLLSAGVYDLAWNIVSDTANMSNAIATETGATHVFLRAIFNSMGNAGDVLMAISGFQALLFVAVIVLAALAFACICQGGLVFGLGALRKGDTPTVSKALNVGARAFWPVAALNAVVISSIWILRFFTAFALYLSLSREGMAARALYIAAFLVFFVIQYLISIVQIFALNALIIQGATISKALERAYDAFKKHWIVTIETAVLLGTIGLSLTVVYLGVVFLVTIPLLMSLVTALVFGSAGLFIVATGIATALFILTLGIGVAFLTQLQYATWTLLYRRIGEGGVLPKVHRWYRSLTGSYDVAQR